MDVACDLARCIPLLGKDKSEPTAEELAERRRYADEVVELLREAVAGGFADRERLEREASLDPLRDRGDFRDLLRSMPPGAAGR